jgi:hypothetical protein
MRVDAHVEAGRLTLAFEPDGDDVLHSPRRLRGYYGGSAPAGAPGEPSIWLSRRTCTFQFPTAWTLEDVHPDVLALAIAFLVFPFARTRLRVPRPVSADFARDFEVLTTLRIEPTGAVARHDAGNRGRTGLAFSGGVDSTAAVGLLPSDTALVHANRGRPNRLGREGQRPWSRFSTEGALESCRVMARAGREVVVVATDMEYLTAPVGVPTHLSIGVPALLLSGALDVSSVAFGTIMESAYGIGYGRFRDFAASPHWQQPEALYRAAGLRYSPVAAGLSEVATLRAVRALPYGGIARSCARGRLKPCGRCVKCFRKGLAAMALDSRFDDAALDRGLSSPQVIRELLTQPIHHANVYAWAAQRYTGRLQAIRALRNVVDEGDLAWMERWYSPSAELLPDVQMRSVTEAAGHLVGPMTARDLSRARSYREDHGPQRLATNAALLRAALLSNPMKRLSFAADEAAAATWRRARRLGLRVVRRMAMERPRR